ncbi:Protein O-linked-mannose beta-1,2-N-acetylglucosaminyltransferase 1, partial [Halocaridina rubra]
MTSEFGSELELPSVLNSLTTGRILIIAVKNDAAMNLSAKSRDLLESLGVTSAHELAFRNFFAWVGTVGGRVWGEASVFDRRPKKVYQWSSPVTLEMDIPKADHVFSCFDNEDSKEILRASFCERYDGYGNLCSCEDPAPLLYSPVELDGSTIPNVPLVVIASNRPTYLYRCLLSILRQAGGHLKRILVIIDGYHQEVRDLLRLLQVPFIEHKAEGINQSSRISDHYRFSITQAFSHFPKASKAILLEEDLLVAPDFFSYFNQTAWLLDEDPSLWCISAWNDLSGLHVAHDPMALRRVETLPGLGWMLTRSIAQQLLSKWPSRYKEHDWDLWARGPEMLSGRECIVPDVGRTFHFGLTGAHSPGLLHAAFFSARPVSNLPYVQLRNVERMMMSEYEADIYHILENDPMYINTTLHPCDPQFIPKYTSSGRPVVIFIDMRTFIDYF